MYKLFSERIKNKDGEPEVYIYDSFPETFRNQIFYIIEDVMDKYQGSQFSLWNFVHDSFAREKGLKSLAEYGYEKDRCDSYVCNSNDVDFLDFIDFTFHIFDGIKEKNLQPQYHYIQDLAEFINSKLSELNYRFKQHNLGYEFVNGEVIRIDNKVIHEEIIKPALKLLYEEGFEGAEEEFLKAFEKRRKGDNKNSILEAGKSFESTMKTICDKKGYTYNATKDTAQKLINILKDNNFFPDYMEAHLTSFRTTLETGLPTLRNKTSGHGQGSEITPISDDFAEYALNLAATNIVFLVGLYKNNK